MKLPVEPPVAPMLAKAVKGLPPQDGTLYYEQMGRLPLHHLPRR